jgi:hypothetical protein
MWYYLYLSLCRYGTIRKIKLINKRNKFNNFNKRNKYKIDIILILILKHLYIGIKLRVKKYVSTKSSA